MKRVQKEKKTKSERQREQRSCNSWKDIVKADLDACCNVLA